MNGFAAGVSDLHKTMNNRISSLLLLALLAGAPLLSGAAENAPVIANGPGDVLGRSCQIAYYPSLRAIRYLADLATCPNRELSQSVTGGTFSVRKKGEPAPLAQTALTFDDRRAAQGILALPDLPDGQYEGAFTFAGQDAVVPGIAFERVRFPWEGNRLGITEKIYPPFEPVRVEGWSARVVLREYRMNGFGLWDQAASKGRGILAKPMGLVLQTSRGKQEWTLAESGWEDVKPQRAIFRAHAVADAMEVRTASTIEFDGCMKVEMELSPGRVPEDIQRLWIEIALPDREAPLFHNCPFDAMRRSYSGPTPRGGRIVWGKKENAWVPPTYKVEPGPADGVIWTSSTIAPWKNTAVYDFTPYIWLGGAERGLAWFAGSDKGWIPATGQPDQELVRAGESVVLRLYLINRPAVIKEPRKLVFGLQASPTRPMPTNWRANPKIPSHSGSVHCWGGYLCSSKYPADHDWSVVDRLLEIRKHKAISTEDKAFFEEHDRKRSQPQRRVFDQEPWLNAVMGWARTLAAAEDKTPFPIYFEEHKQDEKTPEWAIFQDEWDVALFTTRGQDKTKAAWRAGKYGLSETGGLGGGELTFARSHVDFAVWHANEWLRRGVGLYYDNTMLYTQYDPLVSDAYMTDQGRIQPAASIWAQREYYRRIWNLMNEWTEKGVAYPLTFTNHMTNQNILPLLTWNTANLDNEWERIDYATKKRSHFPWQVLLTEMTGRQSGSIPHSLYPISGVDKAAFSRNTSPEIIRAEWGMRMVHEIYRRLFPYESFASPRPADAFEKLLWEFGYGKADCQVFNYWDDQPWLRAGDEEVKWIAMVRPARKPFGLVILQSYRDTQVKVDLHLARGSILCDVETGERISRSADSGFAVTLPPRLGMRLYYVAETEQDLQAVTPLGTR